jgi:hypothetical protein
LSRFLAGKVCEGSVLTACRFSQKIVAVLAGGAAVNEESAEGDFFFRGKIEQIDP